MSNKENKVKKKKLVVNFPSGYFTINDLQKQHSDAVNITLRFKLNQSIQKKEVSLIGTMKLDIGRPQLVYARNPILNKTLIDAQEAGVMLNSNYAIQVAEALKIRSEVAKKEAASEVNEVETSISNTDVVAV